MNYIIPCRVVKSSSNGIEHWLYITWLISCAWFSFFLCRKKATEQLRKKLLQNENEKETKFFKCGYNNHSDM